MSYKECEQSLKQLEQVVSISNPGINGIFKTFLVLLGFRELVNYKNILLRAPGEQRLKCLAHTRHSYREEQQEGGTLNSALCHGKTWSFTPV